MQQRTKGYKYPNQNGIAEV